MKNIQKTAHQIISDKHIKHDTLASSPCLEELVKQSGYKIYRYDHDDAVIKSLNAESTAETSLAFTMHTLTLKCVFVKKWSVRRRISAAAAT